MMINSGPVQQAWWKSWDGICSMNTGKLMICVRCTKSHTVFPSMTFWVHCHNAHVRFTGLISMIASQPLMLCATTFSPMWYHLGTGYSLHTLTYHTPEPSAKRLQCIYSSTSIPLCVSVWTLPLFPLCHSTRSTLLKLKWPPNTDDHLIQAHVPTLTHASQDEQILCSFVQMHIP